MILVDTSIWVDHLRRTELNLVRLLDEGSVLVHPFVIGELACGNLRNRWEILRLLENLPESKVANHAEAMALIEKRELMGKGIGFVDVHLLASALMSNVPLWSRDKRLSGVARELGIEYPSHGS